MKVKLDLITLLTDDIEKMREFYSSILGFEIDNNHDDKYIEFNADNIRFAICHNDVLYEETEHESYRTTTLGQRVELAFEAENRDEVNEWGNQLQGNDVTIIKEPHETPWGLYTLIFEDPEGNINEIFCKDE